MATFTFHKQLPTHLGRVGLSTFHQLVSHLLLTTYTAEFYPKLGPDERKKLARSDVADAVTKGKAGGTIIERPGVIGRGLNPRATLLFDSSSGAKLLPEHYQKLYACWRRPGRMEMTVLYSPKSKTFFGSFAADYDPSSITAELVASSIYFSLPEDLMEGWRWVFEKYDASGNSRNEDLQPTVTSMRTAESLHGRVTYLLPVVRAPVEEEKRQDDQRIFLELIDWIEGYRRNEQDTEDPFQIWMPDPESILP